MEFLFDTANIADIKKYGDIFPYTGVTSNPSIIKAAGKIDFFPHFREIRHIIGKERTLHIQTLAEDCGGILKEADLIFEHVEKSQSPKRRQRLWDQETELQSRFSIMIFSSSLCGPR